MEKFLFLKKWEEPEPEELSKPEKLGWKMVPWSPVIFAITSSGLVFIYMFV